MVDKTPLSKRLDELESQYEACKLYPEFPWPREKVAFLLRLARLAVRASDAMIEHEYNFSAADGEKIHMKDCIGCQWLRDFEAAGEGK